MRRSLLGCTAVLALLAAEARPANAQVPVIDAKSIAQDIQNFTQTIDQMRQDYQVYLGIFGSLLRTTDPNSVASQLMSAANPMPGANMIAPMMMGSGNFGNLSGLANQFLRGNTYYAPTSTGPGDFSAEMIGRRGNTLAGVQAMAQQSFTSIQTHIAGLNDIQAQLSIVNSQADVAAIQGRLQAEQANLAAQGVQAESLRTMLAAQEQTYELQQIEKQRQDADALLASATGNVGAGADGAQVAVTTPGMTMATVPPPFSALGN